MGGVGLGTNKNVLFTLASYCTTFLFNHH